MWQLYLQDCEDLGFAIWIHVVAYAGHWLWPRNGRKWFLKKISTVLVVLKGVGSMEVFLQFSMRVYTFSMEGIWMVLKGGWLYAVGTLGHCLASRPGMMWLTFALCPLDVLWDFLFPAPDCLDLHCVLKWFLLPHLWHFLSQAGAFSRWVRHSTLTAYLTLATLGPLALTFPLLEGPDLTYGGCHCNSSIGLVLVEVLNSCLMLFCAH